MINDVEDEIVQRTLSETPLSTSWKVSVSWLRRLGKEISTPITCCWSLVLARLRRRREPYPSRALFLRPGFGFRIDR